MKYIKIKHTNVLEQVLIGSILGDGYLSPLIKGSINSRLSYGHGEKQYKYLKWKYDILNKIGIVTKHGISRYVQKNDRYKTGQCISYHVRTKTHPFITPYRELTYVNNKKILNFNIIKNIKALGLTIWFMDDGFVTTNSVSFATDCFTIEELLHLQLILWNNFNLLTTFGDSKQLHIRYQYFNKFINIIKPFIIESMKYKLVPYKKRVLYKQNELLEYPEVDNQQPNLSSNTLEGSTTNSRSL